MSFSNRFFYILIGKTDFFWSVKIEYEIFILYHISHNYTSFRSLRAVIRLRVSAYSIYPELSPLLKRVSRTLCLSLRFSISSMRKLAVASPSRLGLVAIRISIFFGASSIREKSFEKLRSHTKTPFIGEIAPPKI